MKTNNLLSGIIAVTALAFSGCAKDGATGPAGATGATGNANVQNFSFATTTASWTLSSGTWFYNYSLPSTTNMSGAVFMYLQSGTVFTQLSFTQNDKEYYFAYDTNAPHVGVYVTSASGASSIPNPGALNFKVVVIPPASIKANPTVNWKNYDEVKKTFNLSN